MTRIFSRFSLALCFIVALSACSRGTSQTDPLATISPAVPGPSPQGAAGGPEYAPRIDNSVAGGTRDWSVASGSGEPSGGIAPVPASFEIVPAATIESGSPTGPMGTAAGMGIVRNGPPAHPNYRPFHRMAFAAKMGTMGAGFEVAVPLSRHTNLRSTGNVFSYSHTFNQDGVDYTGTISLRSMQTTLDWFPFRGGFHISPGFFAYGGNNVKAHASVPGGQIFTLNDTDYRSSAIDPIHGSGKVTVNNAGPGLTVGWGNLLPRNRRHFSFPFEVGAIYEGAPKIALQLGGSACDTTGINCSTVASDPSFQQNLTDEQVKLNKDVEPYKFYPIISFGFAVNF